LLGFYKKKKTPLFRGRGGGFFVYISFGKVE